MKLFDYLRKLDPTSWFDMPVLIADEIVAQIDALELPDDYTPSAAEYGICAPPFRHFFIEATSEVGGDLYQRGVFCEDVTEYILGQGDPSTPHGQLPPEVRWVLCIHGWRWVNKRYLFSFPSRVYLHMDGEGRLLENMEALNVMVETYREMRDPFYLPPGDLTNHVPFALKAVSALHRRCEVEHVKPTRQWRRHHQREHGVEPAEYHVLKVRPNTKRYDFAAVGQPANAARREHLVRGHFRYYHPDKPLFGRPGLAGMVWIPEHERGEDTIGKIRKDYLVPGEGER